MRISLNKDQMKTFLRQGYEVETSYARAKNFDPDAASTPELVSTYCRVAYDNWHFTWLRKKPSLPSTIRKLALVEKTLRAPLSHLIQTGDRETFERDDFLAKRGVIPLTAIKSLSRFLHSQETYYDIYRGNYVQQGLHAPEAPATVYVRTLDFASSPAFWDIITAPAVYETATSILGKRAKITWAWLWYSNPREGEVYQNQNWHRDTGEPFNFIRFFVPLTPVRGPEDGPTVVVKSSSRKEVLYERRRFTEDEVVEALGMEGITPILAEPGDLYCANTFCLHRGLPPQRPREMLSLLVSYQNSYRTKGLPLIPLSSLTERQRDFVRSRKYFFSQLCDFDR